MAYKLNPTTGLLDIAGIASTGGSFTGDVQFQAAGFIMVDSLGNRWRVTINQYGALVTSAMGASGSPIGLLLSLTYY